MLLYQQPKGIMLSITVKINKSKEEIMPTRIPIYRDDMFERMDRNKAEILAELKQEMNNLVLLILAKLEPCVYGEETKKPIKKK